jgi:hypothetical protein
MRGLTHFRLFVAVCLTPGSETVVWFLYTDFLCVSSCIAKHRHISHRSVGKTCLNRNPRNGGLIQYRYWLRENTVFCIRCLLYKLKMKIFFSVTNQRKRTNVFVYRLRYVLQNFYEFRSSPLSRCSSLTLLLKPFFFSLHPVCLCILMNYILCLSSQLFHLYC